MRYDTLLRTARVIVERQAAFLVRGEEAMAPLTLKEVAEEIGMHESTVSRITTGKFLQTPRGTFELKRFFAVRLEGASVSGQAVKAMVRRLIDAEPAGARWPTRPLPPAVAPGGEHCPPNRRKIPRTTGYRPGSANGAGSAPGNPSWPGWAEKDVGHEQAHGPAGR